MLSREAERALVVRAQAGDQRALTELLDDPETLETLAAKFSVSRERVRQIEERALKKIGAGSLKHIKLKAAA